MAKGSSWEREIAVKLSLWWTGSERDDIFWRADTSGARATQRFKKGKTTSNSSGDIAAIHPDGFAFLDWTAVECKRGYNRDTIQDLVDCKKLPKDRGWNSWIEQAERARELSGALHWMIIARRDNRIPVVLGCESMMAEPQEIHDTTLQIIVWEKRLLTLLPLDSWLEIFSRKQILERTLVNVAADTNERPKHNHHCATLGQRRKNRNCPG